MGRRVAIIGARGIGRHHANWWCKEGAEVCALVGTTPASVEAARATLEGLFGFRGRTYTDVSTMLAEARPDFVDVCSPPECHASHVRAALEAGAHVLCEKPFVYDETQTAAALLEEAAGLLDLARERGRMLAVCTQYTTGAAYFRRFYQSRFPDRPVTRYHGHLESPANNRPAEPRRVWVDLSPHIISVLVHLFPGARVDWDSLRTRFHGYEALAEFEAALPTGDTVHCELYTRNRTEPPLNVRHFRLNGHLFDVQADRDEQGDFCVRLVTPDGAVRQPDMMRLLIRDFLTGTPPTTGEAVLENLRLMLEIRDRAEAAPSF